MKTYLLGLIGLAIFGGNSLIGQTLTFGGECGGTEVACNGSCNCCPRCGCKLVAVCHPTCETKKETTHEYSCVCKDICIPHVTPVCQSGGASCCDNSSGSGACGPCNNGCEGCCRVRTVQKLVIHPVTKEHCVRGCTVTWTCPNCGGCCGGSEATSVPSVAPVAPGPAAPAPAPNTQRLPPPPTTGIAPMPENIRMASTGF